jgi:hypothetical protein
MSPLGLGCVKTCAREEAAELFSSLASTDQTVFTSVFIFPREKIETNFLSANSISEFSHSLGQPLHFRDVRLVSAFPPIATNRGRLGTSVSGHQRTHALQHEEIQKDRLARRSLRNPTDVFDQAAATAAVFFFDPR